MKAPIPESPIQRMTAERDRLLAEARRLQGVAGGLTLAINILKQNMDSRVPDKPKE